MKRVFVRFGELTPKAYTLVYEGVVKDDEVQLIIPTVSHSGARALLESLGFGDEKIYVVTGEIARLEDDKIYLKKAKIVQELIYKEEKLFIPDDGESNMKKFFQKNPDKDTFKMLKALQKQGNSNAFDQMYFQLGFWGTFKQIFIAYLPFAANKIQRIGLILGAIILAATTIGTLVMGIINVDTLQMCMSTVPGLVTAWIIGGLVVNKPKKRKKRK